MQQLSLWRVAYVPLSLVSFHLLTPSPVSSLLLLSPVSSSVSFSWLMSIDSSLPSFVLCLLPPISFSCLPSHISSELGWRVRVFCACITSFMSASLLSGRVTSFASFAHPNAFCWRNGGRHNSHSSVFRVILSGADISQPITVYIYNPVIF